MNKFTSAFVFAACMGLAVSAVAKPGGETGNTGCNGTGNPGSPCQVSGGGTGGDGGTGIGTGVGVGVGLGVGLGVGYADAESTSRAVSESEANSASNSAVIAAQDQTLRNNIDIAGDTTTVKNGSESSSSAVNAGNTLIIGGTSYGQEGGEGPAVSSSTLSPTATASNGDQVNTQENTQTVGDTNVTVVNEGLSEEAARELGQPDIVEVDARSEEVDNSQIDASTTINNSTNYKQAVATAAPVFSSVCTSGASTQTRSLGIGLAVTSSVCEHLMMADAFNAMGNLEMVNQHLTKASKIANFRGSLSKFRSLITVGIL